ncbi:MAG TPA: enoyl-CoA hydratase/isomerase family protein [Solirubrobacterales bacterium]|nr:enoyl-CoA hydratase/isomerase family protein [Solirubrobacterales bacterium]
MSVTHSPRSGAVPLRDLASLYDELTEGRAIRLRVEQLLERAAATHPSLVPGPDEVAAERRRELREQHGIELAQGRLLAAWLADPGVGTHLLESMLRPKPESVELLPAYIRDGRVDLGVASVERQGDLGVVTLTRPERLNAENDETTVALETAVDLVLLDSGSEAGVLRGGVVDHPRYRGRRVFSSGLDLSELYAGRLSYLFFMVRDLGFVTKMLRGMAPPDVGQVAEPTTAPEGGDAWLEVPWLAGVETFAIGGGAQLLLVMDRVVAERDALLSLPASREGIIPGAAALRLPRFTGLSVARRSIMFDEQWPAESSEGRLLVDEVVERDHVGDAIATAAERLLQMGPVSVLANRRALRAAQEPLDSFRAFMSTYAIEQARCLTSEALVKNLERTWVGRRAEA